MSDKQIARITRSMRTLAEILDRYGTLEFEDKLKAMELFDIRARFAVKEGRTKLILSVYNAEFDELSIDVRNFQTSG